ncbi:uncharacterized protein LOC121999406 [Zingiber officinale]|uniref:uncharacterized protein LOC121999406 n=1 Tax=Zingiber officinale TaxID=94328 RepID=UPI001C4A7C50|nr:uncharacterized protein LOC121999406 [Zingiber officinale]
MSSALWTSISGYITDFIQFKLAPHKGLPVLLEKDARVKVVAAFGMAFLRNKNGAAVEQFLKPVPHPLRICGWSALRVTECLKSHRTLSTQASDRFNINSQLEHLQTKYVGTGHADLNRFEWGVNIQRDSYASYIGHYPILAYFSVAENESIGRQRYNFMQKMLLPCGLPPEREED